MTVSATARKATFNGSGTTGPFTFNFRVLDSSHITVTHIDSGGTKTTYVVTTNYTITLTDEGLSGGSITTVVALAVGEQLIVEGATPLTQAVKYSNQGRFFPENHETSFDRLTLIAQELDERVDRSLKLPSDSTLSEPFLPDPVADNVLAWNAGATAIVNAGVTSAQVATVANAIANVNAVGNDIANVNTVAGDIANVNTVAGISSDVTTVAGISANVTTVAGISANVTTVAGISANVTTVAGISSDVTTVAGVSSDVTTVATDIADVSTCATNIAAIIAAPTEAANAASSATAAASSATAAATSAASLADFRQFTSAGSSNAYTGDLSPDATLSDGAIFRFKANHTNTGAATMNIDSLGAKTIKKLFNSDLASGDIQSGGFYWIQYDLTNDVFQLISALGQAASAPDLDGLTDVTITAASTNDIISYNGSAWVNTATPTVSTLTVASDIIHSGDTDTKIELTTDAIGIQAGGVQLANFIEDTQDVVRINPDGASAADVDFEVLDASGNEALKVDAGTGLLTANKIKTWVKLLYVSTLDDTDYDCLIDVPEGFDILTIRSQSASGTCTATVKIGGVALGGTANSVSSTSTTQAHSSANTVSAGDDVTCTVSSNSSCLDMYLWAEIEGSL